MLYVLLATVTSIIGILLKGLLHLSNAESIVLLTIPFLFIYKLLGNRPPFLVYAGPIAGMAGGVAAAWGYVIVPIQYYYHLWGGIGIVAGIIAAILIPLELVLFLVVAFLKGGAVVYIANFFGGLCFGLSGLFLFNSSYSKSIWSFLSRKKKNDVA